MPWLGEGRGESVGPLNPPEAAALAGEEAKGEGLRFRPETRLSLPVPLPFLTPPRAPRNPRAAQTREQVCWGRVSVKVEASPCHNYSSGDLVVSEVPVFTINSKTKLTQRVTVFRLLRKVQPPISAVLGSRPSPRGEVSRVECSQCPRKTRLQIT